MATTTRRPERRGQPLSREQIVRAAVELLDDSGESGLTFRALAGRLATGPGAIYWHISGKGELLAAAAEAVIAGAIPAGRAGATPQPAPRKALHALALGLFDAMEAHPWLGTQLVVNPRQSPMLRIFETIGRQVRALGVPPPAEFTAASALLSYILGVAGQNAAAGHAVGPGVKRSEFLGAAAAEWERLDPDEYAFLRSAAGRLRDHDDRAEFLAGLDLVLAGITTELVPPR
jgi:AcrR family transcriptional regulator